MTDSQPEPDRRVLKTKAALRDAMLALMAPRGWDQMTIQEICERANVGRSTFYMHYQSKDDLLSEGLNDLRDMIAAQTAPAQLAGCHFLPGLLDHMAQQRDVFRAAIGRRGGHGVARRFRQMVLQLVEIELERRRHPAAARPWVARFVAGGIVEAMTWWVDAAEPPPIATMQRELDALAQAALSGKDSMTITAAAGTI
ncbi:TetR/AcrR family transcriptional regulator [Duganella violaceipulchra]|uniref:AcrR family transcriptional regulator n=1 Tax=Duganella violaceipulchra TaxID=2849652 RepID=A0AA41L799_9BURK|nr:TetR/AcrR family transcriptional regulator [Duganella violaceicalia]MBV6324102.1 TetR/AcrR family transcriptional regulator [Duganella violaceicalia]MCP2011966.1 AcrR family transcriptional regulator [Duganella violaceicalia]